MLRMVDALWTKEEREQVISNGPPDGRNAAFTIFNHVVQRVKQCCHVHKKTKENCPKTSHTFTSRGGDGLKGLSNQIADHIGDVTSFVPKWDKPNQPRQSFRSLQEVTDQKTEALRREMQTRNRATSHTGNRRNSTSTSSRPTVRRRTSNT